MFVTFVMQVSELEELVGGDLKKQLDQWVAQGTIEPR
jgi:hypothetical protein